MLSVANATGDAVSDRLRDHSPKRAGRRETARVFEGLSIGPLRAAGGPPRTALATRPPQGLSRGLRRGLDRDLNEGQEGSVSLLDLPADGAALANGLGAAVSSVSPLTAGLSRDDPPSMNVLQSRLNSQRQRLASIDNRSRFLQASQNPLRENAGFGIMQSFHTFSTLG